MKAIDINSADEERYLKALVYGQSGTGKTGFGVSAPKPLILLSESQAVPHIRAAQLRLGRKVHAVLVMESLDDYRHALAALRADKAQPFVVRDAAGNEVLRLDEWPESVVLDSVTDACELVSGEIREQSPPKIGRDGLPVDSERYWNVFQDRATKLIRAFRDVPLNVVFLCLLDERIQKDDDGKELSRWVGPQLAMRKLPNVVQSAVNVVGVTYRRRAKAPNKAGERPMEYGIATIGPEWMQLKPFPPIRDHEVMDFSSWCQRIRGIDDGSKAPEPMDAATDVTAAQTAGDVTAAPKAEPGKPADQPAAQPESAPEPEPAKEAAPAVDAPKTKKNPKSEPAKAAQQEA